MKPATWRPERRNRKIGTAASGHGQSNKMVIPNSWVDRYGFDTTYSERISPSSIETFTLGTSGVSFLDDITILHEEPKEGFTYGCTPKDVVHVLRALPEDDIKLLDTIVFRQPTKKQIQLNPVWGRMMYIALIGTTKGNTIGTTIYLEAQEIGSTLRWNKKQSLAQQAELKRLRSDGHAFDETSRHFITTLSEETIRSTLLYRTLLHEMGHWKQYEREVLDCDTRLSKDLDTAYDLYFAQPSREREEFAHRYAAEMGEQLQRDGLIPFAPME